MTDPHLNFGPQDLANGMAKSNPRWGKASKERKNFPFGLRTEFT